ncbi:MAG TPA: NAD/NADP octopine/nopaline dehydrogenase family protein [Stellaceae bacterium]|nr:NAD/NADP octopine/nopaline dehydrogenase family protein [Stellaceae bacterium]
MASAARRCRRPAGCSPPTATAPTRPPAPRSWTHKYIAEDVPVGLMPMRALGEAAGVPTPAMDAVVRLAQILAGNDFTADARTLDRMGLAGMDAEQIKATLKLGF